MMFPYQEVSNEQSNHFENTRLMQKMQRCQRSTHFECEFIQIEYSEFQFKKILFIIIFVAGHTCI